jgi:hypothetical protein
LHIDVQVPNDEGTLVTGPRGEQVGIFFTNLNYTMIGTWQVGTSDYWDYMFGWGATGFQAPRANLPTNGTATYGNPSSTFGTIYAPSSDGSLVQPASVSGHANINVDFGTGALGGTLTNMTVQKGGVSTPWNDVNLSGSISFTDAGITGATAATGSVAGQFGFSGSAKGQLQGNFFGPAGQEIGLAWTLYDPPGAGAPGGAGKTAIGVLAATKQ